MSFWKYFTTYKPLSKSQRWMAVVLLAMLTTIKICFLVVGVDGDSCYPLKTGDRLICARFLKAQKDDIVAINHPVLGRIVKIVVEDSVGAEHTGKIIHADELAVEGSNPSSKPVGIVKRSWIVGVARLMIFFPKENSSADRADGPKPKALQFEPAPAQVPHDEIINGQKVRAIRTDRNGSTSAALSVAGDWSRDYRPGRFVYDAGSGVCYKITRTTLTDPPNVCTQIEVEGSFTSAVIGQKMYLLDKEVPNGKPLDPITLKPMK